jgi:hypothetical protein
VTAATVFTIEAGAGGSFSGATYTSQFTGTWTVTGTNGAMTDTASLTVTAGGAAVLSLDPVSATLFTGNTQTMTATVTDALGNPIPGAVISWVVANGPGTFVGIIQVITDDSGQARAFITSAITGTSIVRVDAAQFQLFDTSAINWIAVPQPPVPPTTTTTIPPTTPTTPPTTPTTPTTTTTTPPTTPPVENLVFSVDFQGKITQVAMAADGTLLANMHAVSPDGTDWLDISAGTKVFGANGQIINLVLVRPAQNYTPPEGGTVIEAYLVTPSGALFSQHMEFTIGYSMSTLPQNAEAVNMSKNINDKWAKLNAESNIVAGVEELTSVVEEFGIYAVVVSGRTPRPELSFQGLTIAPQSVKYWLFPTFFVRVGGSVIVTVNGKNTGEQAGGYVLDYYVGDTLVSSTTGTLNANQSLQISNGLDNIDLGKHVIRVAGMTGEFESKLWVNWWLIGGLFAAVVVASWYLVYRQKRSRAK